MFSTTQNLRHLRQPVDKTEWGIAPTKVNAYYNPPYNQFGKHQYYIDEMD
jgi:putative endopeptidase